MSFDTMFADGLDWMARHNPLELIFGEFSLIRPHHLENLAYASAILFLAAGLVLLHKRNFSGVSMLLGALGGAVSVYGFAAADTWTQTAFVTGKATHDTPIFVTAAFITCIVCAVLALGVTGWLALRHANPRRKWLQIIDGLVVVIVLGLLSNGFASYYDSLFQVANQLDRELWLALLLVLCAGIVTAWWHTAQQRQSSRPRINLGSLLPQRGGRARQKAMQPLTDTTEKETRTDLTVDTSQGSAADSTLSSIELSTPLPTDAIRTQQR